MGPINQKKQKTTTNGMRVRRHTSADRNARVQVWASSFPYLGSIINEGNSVSE
jgi:hypothetical protein